MALPPGPALILFDGACVLCSRSARFIIARDRARLFRFVPLQSPHGAALCREHGLDPDDPATALVIADGVVHRNADLVLAILARLPGWRWTVIFRLVPRLLRDGLYRLVARNRYRWFGRREVCVLPGDPAFEGRLVTERPGPAS